jgi:hypothetical protein
MEEPYQNPTPVRAGHSPPSSTAAWPCRPWHCGCGARPLRVRETAGKGLTVRRALTVTGAAPRLRGPFPDGALDRISGSAGADDARGKTGVKVFARSRFAIEAALPPLPHFSPLLVRGHHAPPHPSPRLRASTARPPVLSACARGAGFPAAAQAVTKRPTSTRDTPSPLTHLVPVPPPAPPAQALSQFEQEADQMVRPTREWRRRARTGPGPLCDAATTLRVPHFPPPSPDNRGPESPRARASPSPLPRPRPFPPTFAGR